MQELTIKQKELLRKIAEDKFSIGAFSGMIFNQFMTLNESEDRITMENCIIIALDVRLKIEEMIK